MPVTPHVEKHFTASETVRDAVIGMSDGLTVPFALAAGLSGAVDSSRIVVLAGLAEIAAGAIAMGLGGYLAARTDMEHYRSERQREIDETREMPEEEAAEVARVFEGWGLTGEQIQPIITAISADETRWVDFMMRFELGLEEPPAGRALKSAATIAFAYVAGGLIPLSPYMIQKDIADGLVWSVAVTVAALFLFGWVSEIHRVESVAGGLQTAAIGGTAAAAAFAIAKIFQ